MYPQVNQLSQSIILPSKGPKSGYRTYPSIHDKSIIASKTEEIILNNLFGVINNIDVIRKTIKKHIEIK